MSTIELANQIDNYIAMEKKEIEAILKSLSLLVAAEVEGLQNNLELLTSLDIILQRQVWQRN